MRALVRPVRVLFPAPAAVTLHPAERGLAALVLVTLGLRLAWAALLPASNDEAYHFLYATHPALSYFDHPPMTAWLAKLGIALCGGTVNELSLRLAFALLFAGSTLVAYRWAARWHGPRAGFFAALLLNLSGYHSVAGGLALPDAPFLFFALCTMWALGEALVAQPTRVRPWVWVGLAFGGALLSKYHGVFLPAGAVLYCLVTPGARRVLRTPGPYLAVAIGFALFAPVLVWNAQHDWASFRFQGGRAAGGGFDPTGFLAVLLGPVAYLLPWVWAILAWQLVKLVRRWRSVVGTDRLAVCLAVVPLAAFTAVGCSRWVLLHWPLIGYVALLPTAGAAMARWADRNTVRSRWAVATMAGLLLAISGVGLAQARFGVFDFEVAGKDPLTDASGWDSVAAELEARGLLAEPNTAVITMRWFDSGQLAFALRERVPVLCYNIGDARGFAYWSRPDDWVGWNALYVTTTDNPDEPQIMGIVFRTVEPVASFPMTRGGKPFRTVWVYRCTDQYRGFPFTYKR